MKRLEISLLLQSVSTMFLLILPGFFLDEQENEKSGINLLTRETDANTVLNIRVTEVKDTLVVLKDVKVF